MTKEIENIKKGLAQLAYYEELADSYEKEYEADFMNPDREEAFERAYELQFNAFVWVSEMIARFAGIDEKTARKMVMTKRNEILNIIQA